jgi:hypothetical protein
MRAPLPRKRSDAPREGHVELPEFLPTSLANHAHLVFLRMKKAKAANLRLFCRRAASLLGGNHVAKSLEILASSWLRRLATRQSLGYGIGDIYSEVCDV